MKNTFLGLVFLSVLWLSSCGGSANPEKKPDSAVTATSMTDQANASGEVQPENNTVSTSNESGEVVQLTKAIFLEHVYNYEKNPDKWTFEGDKPCIIDFYADWCRPCKMVAPIMEELSAKYKGQVTIYKVNTDQERELAGFFGIRSIPTVFFVPAKGEPQMAQGAMPKESYEKAITDFLLKNK